MIARRFALLLALVCFPAARAATWPDWAPTSPLDELRRRFPGEDAVVLVDDWDITVAKSGARSGIHRQVLTALTVEGLAHLEAAAYRLEFRTFSHLRAFVRRSDGRVERYDENQGTLLGTLTRSGFDNTEKVVLRPRNLRVGQPLAIEYRFECAADLPQDLVQIQREIPAALVRVNVHPASGWTVHARVAPGVNPGPPQASADATWEFRSVPGLSSAEELYAPAPDRQRLALDYARDGATTAFADWASTARWAQRTFRAPGSEPLPPPGAPVPDAAGLAALIEKTGRAARAVRYFAIEVGWGGWVPRPSATTLARGLGDCKDKVLVMVDALRRAGVAAVPVLIVSPLDVFVDEALSTAFTFDHAVVGVPWPNGANLGSATVVEAPGLGPLRLYDATLPETSPLDISIHLDGARALALDPRVTGLLTVPQRGGNEGRSVRVQATLAGADLDLRATVTLTGALRHRLLTADGTIVGVQDLSRRARKTALAYCNHVDALAVEAPHTPIDGPWTYEVRFTCRDVLDAHAAVRIQPLPELLEGSPFEAPLRRKVTGAFFPSRATVTDVFELALDDAAVEVGTPEPVSITTDAGRVTLAVTRSPGRVEIRRDVALTSREVPPERFDSLRSLDRAFRRAQDASLVLARRTATSSAR